MATETWLVLLEMTKLLSENNLLLTKIIDISFLFLSWKSIASSLYIAYYFIFFQNINEIEIVLFVHS